MSAPAITPGKSQLSHLFPTRRMLYAFVGLSAIVATLPFLIWPGFTSSLLASNFIPHLYCLGKPGLVWTHVVADSLIGLAYVIISGSLVYLVRKRCDIPFDWMFLAFGLFIVSCGGTHFMEVVTVWVPVYVLSASLKVFTALASVATAVLLPVTLPRIASAVQKVKASEAAEHKFRGLLEAAPDAMVVTDRACKIVLVNTQAERLFGYQREELLGRDMGLLVPERFRDEYYGNLMKLCADSRIRSSEAKQELSCSRKAGTEFPVEASLSPIETEEGILVTSAIRDVTERKRAEEALANVSGRLIAAQEQERTRIARDLHDDIGQRLALLTIELEQIQQGAPEMAVDVRSRMAEMRKQSAEIATDIQSLSHELHSSRLEYLGIAAAMRGFCEEFSAQQKVEIDFDTDTLPNPLSREVSLSLFRVLQEAVHNAAKHSGTSKMKVRLWVTPDEIRLTVSDSGVGFDRDKAANESRGLGLISMEERLKLLNGALSIESKPRHGTTIHARVPIAPQCESTHATG